ncbi:unnamed protein product [Fusarium graminearum]|uniref:Chromosome 3, complete genome n=1 Tax=Gibberella zeae (strain ATCC MYA-4620 / CBS 123657 / FGSC 9075 / NRRL 31084 / PH-1) TaxID=229533 RepID=A0A098E4V7_GIBZE|nr:unnamed protein product [Fusarium graminearum]CZS85330.1 unnamed protein product [Fusarium graminearum]
MPEDGHQTRKPVQDRGARLYPPYRTIRVPMMWTKWVKLYTTLYVE